MGNSSKKSGFVKKVDGVFLAVWVAMVIGGMAMPVAWAADPKPPQTLLPLPTSSDGSTTDAKTCETWLISYSKEEFQLYWTQGDVTGQNTVLGCAIKTGRISLWMVPYFIKYFIEFILYVGGLVAVGGILFGGATYIFSGLSNDKEKGKKAILYSVVGMILMYTAWAIVNIVIGLLTG